MTRIDKAGPAPVVSSQEIHAWVTKWAAHGRSRLALFGWMSKARNLLSGLRELRGLLERLEDSQSPQAVALKAQTEEAIGTSSRAMQLIVEEMVAMAARPDAERHQK